jgi:hypothetical protein
LTDSGLRWLHMLATNLKEVCLDRLTIISKEASSTLSDCAIGCETPFPQPQRVLRAHVSYKMIRGYTLGVAW